MENQLTCLKFQLVSPEKLAEGMSVDDATLLTVGALMRGSYPMDLDPKQLSRLVNRSILKIGHKKKDRANIEASATEPGTWLFGYCSGCGFDFKNTSCRSIRHKVSFPKQLELLARRSYLPPTIARYMMTAGHHRFIFKPPRP